MQGKVAKNKFNTSFLFLQNIKERQIGEREWVCARALGGHLTSSEERRTLAPAVGRGCNHDNDDDDDDDGDDDGINS